MKRFIPVAAFSVAIAAGGGHALAATCSPQGLVHIVVANVTQGIAASSFAAQPKTYYRIGSDRMRIEEAVDAPNGIQGVVVVSEPNIWMANLHDGTGKHIVDPGPTFFAKAPVFGIEGLSEKLMQLEFGCEADFLAANAPKPVRTEQIGNERFDVYRFEDGAEAVEIVERSGSGSPAFARYFHQGRLAMTLRYELAGVRAIFSSGTLGNDPSLRALRDQFAERSESLRCAAERALRRGESAITQGLFMAPIELPERPPR